jgi:hypothetical protein
MGLSVVRIGLFLLFSLVLLLAVGLYRLQGVLPYGGDMRHHHQMDDDERLVLPRTPAEIGSN